MRSHELWETLLQNDNGFRQLVEQHQELDECLRKLSQQPYRTSTEELEKSNLKKRKLQLKDQIEHILRKQKHPSTKTSPQVSHSDLRG